SPATRSAWLAAMGAPCSSGRSWVHQDIRALTLGIDPQKWAAIYEAPRPTAIQYIFRHGAELAREECLARAESGERWLDAGCGTGHLAAELARGGVRMIAVDRREE